MRQRKCACTFVLFSFASGKQIIGGKLNTFRNLIVLREKGKGFEMPIGHWGGRKHCVRVRVCVCVCCLKGA
ncbi:hypothetical protein DFJ73DRAFT_863885 [Zopfochytrium polystomum]|nr:hypothetical protein DFJ73DRAFT_863885 [Zopfochytrium polystomum]